MRLEASEMPPTPTMSGIIAQSVLPKIDEMQHTHNPLERIATLSRFNRWSCKKISRRPGRRLCCSATYADCLSSAINPHMKFRKLVGVCVQSIHTHGGVLHKKWTDPMETFFF